MGLSSWLRHYATSRKVAGSNSDEAIEVLNWPGRFNLIMELKSIQHITEINTMNVQKGIEDGRCVRRTTSQPSENHLHRQCGIFDFL
jgi:hypothetical protein